MPRTRCGEFFFPNFSLNVVSRLDVQGKLSSDKIWTITAKGSTFDAKDLFRSLFSLGRRRDAEIKPLRPANGVDLTADIDTVLGHSDVSMRAYKFKFSKRRTNWSRSRCKARWTAASRFRSCSRRTRTGAKSSR